MSVINGIDKSILEEKDLKPIELLHFRKCSLHILNTYSLGFYRILSELYKNPVA